MIRKLIALFLDANPLLALDSLLAQWQHGRGVHFVCAVRAAGPVLKLLADRGVKTYSLDPSFSKPDRRGFRVRAEQAQFAEYILLRAGVPMLKRPHCPANRNVGPGPLPRPWGVPARPVGLSGAIVSFLLRRYR